MKVLHSWLLGIGLVSFCLSPLAAGCAADDAAETPAAETGDEDEVVPADAKTLWDQATVCSDVLKRHERIRATDYKDGVVRWNCGDVPGVTEGDLGQEYCEYHAVSAGKVVNKLSDVAPGAPVQCLFTSIYKDAFASSADLNKYTTALAAKENLGTKPSVAATQMQVGFNSRGAATLLVVDCLSNSSSTTPLFDHDTGKFRDKTAPEKDFTQKNLTEELRQASCWKAADDATKAGDTKRAASLKSACRVSRGKLLTDSKWKKIEALGAKVAKTGEPAYEDQHSLAACLGSYRSGAVTWRNSDNIICERVTRAASECQCSYNAIPDAFIGFTFGTWTSGNALPAGCRYAKVDAKDNPNLVICELSSTQRDDLELDDKYGGNLQAMCQDFFSKEIVMSAPIRALQAEGSCKPNAGFCSSYGGK